MKQEKHYLSKSTYIRGLQCIKSLYLYKNRYFLKDPISPEQRAKFNRGNEVGILAQQLFPGGIDLSPKTPFQYPKAVLNTAEAVNKSEIKVIYEAAFQYDKVLAAMDILVRGKKGWVAYEVKSSLGISETYKEDVALQYYVISSSGLELEDIRLLHLNPEYRKSGELDLEGLFVSESLLDFAKGRRHSVAENIHKLQKVKEMKSSPKIPIGPQCHHPYPCDFIGHCWKHVPEKSILNLNLIPDEHRFALFHQGVALESAMKHIPDMSEVQKMQLDAITTGKAILNKKLLKKRLQDIDQPSAYLSYILTKPALPLFDGHKPFQEIMIAYAFGTKEKHIADQVYDINIDEPQEILAEVLKQSFDFETIIIEDQAQFNQYIQEAGMLYPELKSELSELQSKAIGINDLAYNGIISPSMAKDRIEFCEIAADFGEGRLKDHKINNMRLAGEIYRQINLSETTIKGFAMDDIEQFLKFHNQGLISTLEALKNL